tara:strand:+ start:1254 stop:1772 length:519 start_codon:yes stop_codon:yes gene_type:complete
MPQKALFVTIQDIKQKSIISGNVDPDKIIQFVEVAQDTHIQNYLGGKLYEKLQALIIANTLGDAGNSDYKTLVDEYVKPMLIWFTQTDYIPFAPFTVSNGGVYKHRSENSDSITSEEISSLERRARETAEFYTRRFMDYMDFNSSKYPEYLESSNEDMHPDKDVNFGGIYLG